MRLIGSRGLVSAWVVASRSQACLSKGPRLSATSMHTYWSSFLLCRSFGNQIINMPSRCRDESNLWWNISPRMLGLSELPNFVALDLKKCVSVMGKISLFLWRLSISAGLVNKILLGIVVAAKGHISHPAYVCWRSSAISYSKVDLMTGDLQYSRTCSYI